MNNGIQPTLVQDEAKEVLLEWYAKLVFVDDVTELLCKRCGHVVIHHYVANCGHLFCRKCKRILSQDKEQKCPECTQCITHVEEQKAEVKERVLGLMVHCLNHKYGCTQIIPLGQIQRHLEVCEDSKEANLLKLLFANSNNLEAVVSRIEAMSERMNGLNDTISQSQKQTQDHLTVKMEEMEMKQRQQNESQWTDLENRINAISSDLCSEINRIQTKMEDNHTQMIQELNTKMSKIEEAANHHAAGVEGVRELVLQSQTAIENKLRQLEDYQHRDAERMEQTMERWKSSILAETTTLQTADTCNQKIKDKAGRLKQQLEEMGRVLSEVDDHIREVSLEADRMKKISDRMQDDVTQHSNDKSGQMNIVADGADSNFILTSPASNSVVLTQSPVFGATVGDQLGPSSTVTADTAPQSPAVVITTDSVQTPANDPLFPPPQKEQSEEQTKPPLASQSQPSTGFTFNPTQTLNFDFGLTNKPRNPAAQSKSVNPFSGGPSSATCNRQIHRTIWWK